MQFTPKTEKQIAEMNLWPIGQYSFEVLPEVTLGGKVYSTSDTTSKAGNDMILLVVNVYNESGESKILIDYILESAAAKLRNLCIACGMLDKYESGQVFASDFIGKKGELKLGIEKDKSGQYADKNKVANYVGEKSTNDYSHPVYDDSVPF